MSGSQVGRGIMPCKLIAFAFAAVFGTIGCVSQSLLVRTEPAGAALKVISNTGDLIEVGQAPLTLPVRFEKISAYRMNAEPTAQHGRRFQQASVTVAEADYLKLPLVGTRESQRELLITLPSEYMEMAALEPRITPKGEPVVVFIPQRAFGEIAESGGRAPSMIVDLPKRLGVGGLTLSPNGDRLVFSEAEYDQQLNEIQEETVFNGGSLVYPSQGSNLRAITIGSSGVQHITTEDFQDRFPTFTPDGRFLIFASNRRRPELSDILRSRFRLSCG